MRYLFLLIFVLCAGLAQAVTIQETPRNVYFIEDHSDPLIAMTLYFRAGWAYDPAGHEGTAKFLTAMLEEGAGPYDATAYRRELENSGIDLDFSASGDRFTITLSFLSSDRDRAARLLNLALTQPHFSDSSMARVRDQLLAVYRQELEDPDRAAQDTLAHIVFQGHPYAAAGQYTPESLNRITADGLRQFLHDRLTIDTLAAGAAGDASASDIDAFLGQALAGLAAHATGAPLPPFGPRLPKGMALLKRDLPQSVVAFAAPGIDLHDPDFYTAYVLNYIMGGGGFQSRLMREIRVKRGLSYGIDTALTQHERSNILVGETQTKTASTAETIALIQQEWQRFRNEGPSAAEIDAAKTYIIGFYPRNFANLTDAAEVAASLKFEGRGKDYPDRRQALFAAVTAEDLRRLAQKLLDPDHLTFVVVGAPEGLVPTLSLPQLGQ